MTSSLSLAQKRKKISKKSKRSTSTKTKRMRTRPNQEKKRRKMKTCSPPVSSRTPHLPKMTVTPAALSTKKRRRSPKMSLTQSSTLSSSRKATMMGIARKTKAVLRRLKLLSQSQRGGGEAGPAKSYNLPLRKRHCQEDDSTCIRKVH
jgi:hypothetical protein